MSVNKIILVGNVGVSPEIKYVDAGKAVARISLGTTTPGYSLDNGTQVPERTEWHRLVAWGKTAEIVERYVKKGDKLYVEGSLHTTSYDDKKGIQRYLTEVWIERLELMRRSPEAS